MRRWLISSEHDLDIFCLGSDQTYRFLGRRSGWQVPDSRTSSDPAPRDPLRRFSRSTPAIPLIARSPARDLPLHHLGTEVATSSSFASTKARDADSGMGISPKPLEIVNRTDAIVTRRAARLTAQRHVLCTDLAWGRQKRYSETRYVRCIVAGCGSHNADPQSTTEQNF